MLESLHFLKLRESGSFVESFLIVQADLLISFPEIKKPRLALDEREDEVPVLLLVPVAKSYVYLSQTLGNPTHISKYLKLFPTVGPSGVVLFTRQKVRQHLSVNFVLKGLTSFQVLLTHTGVSLYPLFEVGLHEGLDPHVLVVCVSFMQNLSESAHLLLRLPDLHHIIIG